MINQDLSGIHGFIGMGYQARSEGHGGSMAELHNMADHQK